MNDIEAKELVDRLKNTDLFGDVNYLHRKDNIKSELRYGSETPNPDNLVTIVIPAYRRPDLLERALKSALNQINFDKYEILISDDSEEMASENEAIVRKYNSDKVRYYKSEKALGWYNWNRLIELSNTKWICMLHDDDVLLDKHLYYLTSMLTKCDNPGMVTCVRVPFRHNKAELVIKESDISAINPRKLLLKTMNFQFLSFMLGALIDREKAIKLGGFNDSIISLDFEFIARMVVKESVYECPIITYGYGIKNNESTKSDMWEKMLISEYYICQSISKTRGIMSGLARKVEDYAMAGHIYDMSNPSKNIFGVELDPYKICKWLNIDYGIRNKSIMRICRKMLQ